MTEQEQGGRPGEGDDAPREDTTDGAAPQHDSSETPETLETAQIPEASDGSVAPGTTELSGTPRERLAQLGLELPDVPAPLADYVPAVRTGSYVYTSGQLPFVDGVLERTGVVGDQPVDVTPEQAAELARRCAVNAVAAVASVVDLESVVRVVKVTGFVASAPGFHGQPGVVNGASLLLGQVFGEAGRHARSAVGVASLPLGAPVEVEIVVEVG